ncbi:hypothetical protein P7C70_g809, partial [Phenoliferia sp. Uapishka_3]
MSSDLRASNRPLREAAFRALELIKDQIPVESDENNSQEALEASGQAEPKDFVKVAYTPRPTTSRRPRSARVSQPKRRRAPAPAKPAAGSADRNDYSQILVPDTQNQNPQYLLGKDPKFQKRMRTTYPHIFGSNRTNTPTSSIPSDSELDSMETSGGGRRVGEDWDDEGLSAEPEWDSLDFQRVSLSFSQSSIDSMKASGVETDADPHLLSNQYILDKMGLGLAELKSGLESGDADELCRACDILRNGANILSRRVAGRI